MHTLMCHFNFISDRRELLEYVRAKIKTDYGTYQEFAKQHKVSGDLVRNTLNNNKTVPAWLLSALNIKLVYIIQP